MTDPESEDISPRPSPTARGNRRVLIAAIGALTLLAVAAVVLAFTLGRGPSSSPSAPTSPRSLPVQVAT